MSPKRRSIRSRFKVWRQRNISKAELLLFWLVFIFLTALIAGAFGV